MKKRWLLLLPLVVLMVWGLNVMLRSNDDEPPVAAEQPEPPLRTAGFEHFFEPGREIRVAGEPAKLEVREVGALDVPTGRLIACDPYVQADDPDYQKPFTVTVPPGRYPVSVAVIETAKVGPRVAAARITVRPEPITRWEMAVEPGNDPATLPPDHFFGFGVDAGTAALLDAGSMDALRRLAATEDGALNQATITNEAAMAWDIRDPESGRNVIAFFSGYGDGSYPTWIGRTATGEPAMFVIDFHVEE